MLALAFASSTFAVELVLAPGASVTILDGADPSVTIVMTAPANAPLDLSELLTLRREESVRAIVTRFQSNQAGRMTRNPDGSITLAASAPGQSRVPTPGLAGGVLIRNGEEWLLRPNLAATQPNAPAAAAPAPPPPRQHTISKAGVTREQAERDLAECRQISEKSLTALMTPSDRANAYNNAMYSCLRGFGYEIRG